MTEESVEVSAHDFMRNGGATGREWPWKTLYNNEGASDKWTVNDNSGWLIFKFKKPMQIRGYGVKSADDYPVRDPKNYSFYIHDVFDERPGGQQDWV